MRETGDIECRGSVNYASDEAKEIAHLKRALRDAQDALDVLKKQSTFWENDGNHLSRSYREGRSYSQGITLSFCLRNVEISWRFSF